MRWTSSSHGEEAERLREAREASELGRLAATTALLLEVVSRGGETPELKPLIEDKDRLLERLQSIVDGTTRDEHELPYRQLVPVRVWRQATDGFKQLHSLAESATERIANALSGEIAEERRQELIAELQLLTRRMHQRGDSLLMG